MQSIRNYPLKGLTSTDSSLRQTIGNTLEGRSRDSTIICLISDGEVGQSPMLQRTIDPPITSLLQSLSRSAPANARAMRAVTCSAIGSTIRGSSRRRRLLAGGSPWTFASPSGQPREVEARAVADAVAEALPTSSSARRFAGRINLIASSQSKRSTWERGRKIEFRGGY